MILRDYQQETVDALIRYFYNNPTGNPLAVLPTAAGKSVIIAKFIEHSIKQWPNTRFLMLAHRKELLEQNAEKIINIWPEAPIGIYSAGLNKRQLGRKIMVAGIQSIAKKAHLLNWIDLVIIDEVHLLTKKGNGQYRMLLAALMEVNPNLRVIGFTATPFRLDSGLITEGDGRILTDVCYDVSVRRLIDEGYLSPLITRESQYSADLSGIKVRAGEFVNGELQNVMCDDKLIDDTTTEIINKSVGRNAWLIFCAGVEHVEKVTASFISKGIHTEYITGETGSKERAKILKDFKDGKINCLVNCDVLTTGFDAPNIDVIALLRPTHSAALYVQMVGRGCRIAPGKENCLVLDHAGNIERHGPIDSIHTRPTKKKGEMRGAPVKACKSCGIFLPISARECLDCGYEFPIDDTPKHDSVASNANILSVGVEPQWMDVDFVAYLRHKKIGKPTSMRVEYMRGMQIVKEWVCLDHTGFAKKKAISWIRTRMPQGDEEYEDWYYKTKEMTVDDALEAQRYIMTPKRILIKKVGKHEEILDYEY